MTSFYKWIAVWLVSEIELLMVAAFVAIILRRRESPDKRTGFRDLERRLSRFASHRRAAVITIGLLVLAIRAAIIPLIGIPLPGVHDEFSFALAADTFLSGRITNPTHPMWTHFETFHVIQKPTYMSMYPPAQALVHATGRLMGNAWFGQWIITALMCAGLCWMLQGWLPAAWAFLGGILALLRLGTLSYWMNSYWGGSLAALGGILAFGALPRLKEHGRTRDAILMAVGLVILANTRPYEGLIFSIPPVLATLFWLTKKGRGLAESLRKVVLPAVLILGIAGAAMGYYYYRVTGSPFVMTYQINRGTYAMAPYFLWEKPRPEPEYRYKVMRDFYERELADFEENRTLPGFFRRTASKAFLWWGFFLGPALTIPLFAFPRVLRDRRMKFALLTGAFFFLGLSLETFLLPHYFAPATGLLYLLLLQSMRHLRLWRWRSDRRGLALVRAIPIICAGMIILRLAAVAAHAQIETAWPRGSLKRAAVIKNLESRPGNHLVLVRYGADHNLDDEYVYNGANIDQQRIVWARDMDPCGNQELLDYYRTRQVWLLEPDDWPTPLQPYPKADSASCKPRAGLVYDVRH
jgi:hypothetical protein